MWVRCLNALIPDNILTRSTEQLKALLSQLFQLSSLTIIALPHGNFPFREQGILPDISRMTRILQCVTRAPLVDVRVELRLDTLVRLGCPLYFGNALETCKALEDALIDLPLRRILLHLHVFKRRAGRIEFFSPAIKRAFPRLEKANCLRITPSK